jgi:hypothetical protein
VGKYTVEFSVVQGWNKPGNQSVTITNNQTTTKTGTYIPQTGSLQVTLGPQEAINGGAQWRRVGTVVWQSSGAIETGIPVGQYSVEFSNVTGWTKPGNQAVTIDYGQMTVAAGTYLPPTGSLQVTLSPQGAIDAGARWRVDGGDWHSTGEMQDGLSLGYHTVEFNNVTGWTKPANRTVSIRSGQTATLTGTYNP